MPLPPLPGATSEIDAERVLVLAPHYDDEVIGCGGLLIQLAASGARIDVLFLSDGQEGTLASENIEPHVRRDEARAAAKILGIHTLHELDVPDGALGQHIDALALGIAQRMTELGPDTLLVPSPQERSRDHRAAFVALSRALSKLEAFDGQILLYEINHPLHPDLLVAVETQLPALEQAMACYSSQLAQHDYLQSAIGRRRFRAHTLPAGSGAAEAYRRLAASDFATRSLEGLLAFLGAEPRHHLITDGPLVSVIMRTKDRPELLAEALDSVAASTYRRLHVVLVNDGGERPSWPEDFPFAVDLVDLKPNRGRAAAANAGLAAARGEYVAFLDDDDTIEPEHYAVLTELVGAAGVRVAYTDAAVGVYALDGTAGWVQTERRLPYSRDGFDADLLLLDNYIPFHTLLMEAPLLAEVGGLDDDLPFFEDWDLLIRLAQRTPFHHLAQVTCEYRHFRGGGHHVIGDNGRQRADFLDMKGRVLAKHADLLVPEHLARVIDTLRSESVAALEEVRHSEERLADQKTAFFKLRGTLRAAEDRSQQLRALSEQSRHELGETRGRLEAAHHHQQELRRQVEELEAFQRQQSEELQNAYAEIGRLNNLVDAMQSTPAWRLHEKMQGFKR